MKKIFGKENGLIRAADKVEFDLQRLEFEDRYGKHFTAKYLTDLMDKLETHMLNPVWSVNI